MLNHSWLSLHLIFNALKDNSSSILDVMITMNGSTYSIARTNGSGIYQTATCAVAIAMVAGDYANLSYALGLVYNDQQWNVFSGYLLG